MKNECLFCGYEKFEIIGENDLSYAIRDKYPVARLHTLIISKKHYPTVFDISTDELSSIFSLAKICRENIMVTDTTVQGFNFGSNSGAVAGQKISHIHFHLIPRRIGDIEPSPAVK